MEDLLPKTFLWGGVLIHIQMPKPGQTLIEDSWGRLCTPSFLLKDGRRDRLSVTLLPQWAASIAARESYGILNRPQSRHEYKITGFVHGFTTAIKLPLILNQGWMFFLSSVARLRYFKKSQVH